MASATLSAQKMARYRGRLTEMRDRLLGEVEHVAEGIREEINPTGELSNAPMHLADAAEQIDADIEVFESERDLLSEVQAALHRIEAGSFGICVDCGTAIVEERLDLIPYTRYCVPCATKRESEQSNDRSTAKPR